MVHRVGLDFIIVDPQTAVRVSERHVDCKVVVKRVVRRRESESGECGIGDVKFRNVGPENKPEDYPNDGEEYSDGD